MDYTVFLGDVALDEYYEAERWPKLQEKIMVKTLPAQLGGTIANAACVFAGFGPDTRFAGMLNSGPVTKVLEQGLIDAGLNTDYIIYNDDLPDSKTIVVLAQDEHTVLIPSMEIDVIELDEDMLEALCGAKNLYSNLGELSLLRCGDMGPVEILKKLRASGVRTIADLDVFHYPPELGSLLRYLDIIVFNENGFKNYCGDKNADDALKKLVADGNEVVVVTLAENGCRVVSKEGDFTVPGIPVDVVDVTGAGDTFCASFLYAYDKTGDIKLAARFANGAASKAVGIFGPRGGVDSVDNIAGYIEQKGAGTAGEFAVLK